MFKLRQKCNRGKAMRKNITYDGTEIVVVLQLNKCELMNLSMNLNLNSRHPVLSGVVVLVMDYRHHFPGFDCCTCSSDLFFSLKG